LGLAIFFSAHLYSAFRSREIGRDIKEKIGAGKFMGLYSLASMAGFVLMVWGYGLSRPSTLIFTPPSWGHSALLALMLPVFIILMSAYGPRGYLKQLLRHPMLIAIILWSAGHLLANGELNSLLLFGGFLLFALIDWFAVAGREIAVKQASILGDILAIGLGTLFYWLIIAYLHPMLIGVPVLN
ncbi:MAG: hypothetical protein JKX72_09170, partial [Robiginitomaculum sp.]|nr:hypothetical protein [Robiginitomaculum sp.]